MYIAAAGSLALWLGQDANWDLRNYHFYNPWALLHGRIFGHDIAAAQLQTYHNPTGDLPFYLMVAAGADPRVIAFALAIPAGICAFFVTLIAWLVFADLRGPDRIGATFASALIGLTAAMPISQVATTFNEWPGAALTLMALWLLMREVIRAPQMRLPTRTLCVAGALAGAAVGLKLTAGPYAVALFAALIARQPWSQHNLRDGALFGAFLIVGTAITHGWWSWELWRHYDNPLFPYANDYFASPWWNKRQLVTRVYGPHDLKAWLAFPFRLFSPAPGFVTEIGYTDWRLPLLYALALIASFGAVFARFGRENSVAAPARPPDVTAAGQFLGVFFTVSFILWTAIFSALRYLAPIEILVGILIVLLIGVMLRRPYAIVAIAFCVVALVASSRYPSWGRVDFGPKWFDVRPPAIEPRSLVLLVADAPIAYVLPFFPIDARHLGVHNNLNDPHFDNLTSKEIARTIAAHPGAIYALSQPAGRGEDDLAFLGLKRVATMCDAFGSNLTSAPIELCLVERVRGDDARTR